MTMGKNVKKKKKKILSRLKSSDKTYETDHHACF